MILDKSKLSWAAGFFDGEGCISISPLRIKGKIINYALNISVGQVDSRPLILFKKYFGGNLYKRKAEKFFIWGCGSKHAVKVLDQIAPFLIVKRNEASAALRFGRLLRPCGKKQIKMSPENLEIRKYYHDYLKNLKDVKYNRKFKEFYVLS